MKLWYDEPAENWNHALPVGCGKLGAMVFGGVSNERIQMNEDSIWAGPPVPKSPQGAQQVIARARQLLFEGEYTEAQDLVQEGVMGERIVPRSYQTLGDLLIEQSGVEQHTEYRRELSLNSAIATTQWVAYGVVYHREVFATAIDRAIICRIASDKAGAISCRISFSSGRKRTVVGHIRKHTIHNRPRGTRRNPSRRKILCGNQGNCRKRARPVCQRRPRRRICRRSHNRRLRRYRLQL